MRTLMDIEVTSDGKIYQGEKELTIWKNSKGYWNVWVDGKNKKVHRLVALFHIPNPYNKPEINHKDGNKDNNNVNNLEWVTTQENRDHAIENKLWGKNIIDKRKFTDEEAEQIRNLYQPREFGYAKLAKLYDVDKSTIRDIIKKKSYIKTSEDYGM